MASTDTLTALADPAACPPRRRGGLIARAVKASRARDLAEEEAAQAAKPPSSNTGAVSPHPVERQSKSEPLKADNLLAAALFDWFQFTLPASDGSGACRAGDEDEKSAIADVEIWASSIGLHGDRAKGGANGYRIARPYLDGPEGEAVAALYSGSTSGIMPNFKLSGGNGACARIAPLAQRAFPGLRLSRADVCIDISQPGLFDDLRKMSRDMARRNSKMTGGVTDHGSPELGRTFTMGSAKSRVALKVYQKDYERAAKGRIEREDIDPHLVRIEFSFKPDSRSKVGMGSKTPEEMLRTSVWARAYLVRLAKLLDPEAKLVLTKEAVMREPKVSTLEGSARHGAHQYGRAFSRLAAARIVAEEFGGDYAAASITPDRLALAAADLFRRFVIEAGTVERVIADEGLTNATDAEGRAGAVAAMMQEAASERTAAQAEALRVMATAMRRAGRSDAADDAEIDAAVLAAMADAEDLERRSQGKGQRPAQPRPGRQP